MNYTISYKTKTPAKMNEMVKHGVTCYIEIHPEHSLENAEYLTIYIKLIELLYHRRDLNRTYFSTIHDPITHLNNLIQYERECISDDIIDQLRNFSVEHFGDSIVIDTLLNHDLDGMVKNSQFDEFNEMVLDKRRRDVNEFNLTEIEHEWFDAYRKKSRYLVNNLGITTNTMLSSNMFKVLNEFRGDVLLQPKKVPYLVSDDGCMIHQTNDDKNSFVAFRSFRVGFTDIGVAKKFIDKLYLSSEPKITLSVINELSDKLSKGMDDKEYGVFISKRKNPINGNIGYITIKQFQYTTNMSTTAETTDIIDENKNAIYKHIMTEYSRIKKLTDKYKIDDPLVEFNSDTITFTSTSTDLTNLTSVVDCSVRLKTSHCNVNASCFQPTKRLLSNINISIGTNRYHRFNRNVGKIHIPININTDIHAIKQLFNLLKLTNVIDIREMSMMLLPFCMEDTLQEKLYEVLDELC